MWLYILIVVVIILIVFLLGSYSARTKAVTKGEIQASACGTEEPKEPQGTSGSGSCAPAAVKAPKPCKKHRISKCGVCRSEEDGFSTDAAFLSVPAPFK
jgi:hypothetical protein